VVTEKLQIITYLSVSQATTVTPSVKLEIYYYPNNILKKQGTINRLLQSLFIMVNASKSGHLLLLQLKFLLFLSVYMDWVRFGVLLASHYQTSGEWWWERQRGEHTLVIPRPHLTVEEVDINLDVSSRLDPRQYTEPHIKCHNKKCKICSTETKGLL